MVLPVAFKGMRWRTLRKEAPGHILWVLEVTTETSAALVNTPPSKSCRFGHSRALWILWSISEQKLGRQTDRQTLQIFFIAHDSS